MDGRGHFLGKYIDSEYDLKIAVSSALWFTYRCGFSEMYPYGYTDDAGWGCMLRSAQMLMANALLRHIEPSMQGTRTSQRSRRQVLQWFLDLRTAHAVYSIQNLVKCGQTYDMLPGEWYGPSVAAHILRDLCELHRCKLSGPAVRVIITSIEKALCIEEILNRMTQRGAKHQCIDQQKYYWPGALIVVVPLRLGLDKLEPEYIPQILEALQLPQSLGLIGGRPHQALFFPGVSHKEGEVHLVGLDPHAVQPALLADADLAEVHLGSVRCNNPTYLRPDKLDPSLAFGFYCRDCDDFLDLCNQIVKIPSGRNNPIFNITTASDEKAVDAFDVCEGDLFDNIIVDGGWNLV